MRIRRSKLTHFQTNRLLDHFVAGTPARTAGSLVGVNRNTAITFYHRLRCVIAERLAQETPDLAGEVEVDESYFGGTRKGKRDRGAAGKVPVFGLLTRGGRVCAVVVADTQADTLITIIAWKIKPDSIVYTDRYSPYDKLEVSEFRHVRITHSEQFADGMHHINGIENFWNQAKRHLRKYNGIPAQSFPLFLKECEWRFNYGSPNRLLTTLRDWLIPYTQ